MATTTPDVDANEPRRDRRMSLGEHLKELRRRLLIAAAGVLIMMILAFIGVDFIIDALKAPLKLIAEQRGEDFAKLNFAQITSGFDFKLRIAFAVGLLLSAPVWLWQIWAFIMPGLTKKEIRYTIGFAAAAVPLFFAGAYVGWYITPHVIEIMVGFVPKGETVAFFDAKYYYDFVFKLLLAVGIAFVLPVFLVALNLAGIMSGKAILKGWRVAILVATTFAAIATPAADVTSMLLLAGILIVLYFIATGLTLLLDRRKAKRLAREGEQGLADPDSLEGLA